MSVPTKHCSYCRRWHPEDDFFKVQKGKWGQSTVAQCGNCFRSRKDKAANQVRFDAMVERTKAENKRIYGGIAREKLR
jgi:ribosomal protein S26